MDNFYSNIIKEFINYSSDFLNSCNNNNINNNNNNNNNNR